MVEKRDLRPNLEQLFSGLQRTATAGIARPVTDIVLQDASVEPPDGESDIPVLEPLRELETVKVELDAARTALSESTAAFSERMAGYQAALDHVAEFLGDLSVPIEQDKVAAKLGVFIDAMMQNLTVAGVANLKQVVADELFAKLAVVDKLQALTSIITKDMIATGAITSEKLAANAVSAGMVDVGQNAKWDSNGLIFYGPVVGDQQWDDWATREPVISLTPTGDVSISVASGGQATAGMLPDGHVWGQSGDFNTLMIAGEDITEQWAGKTDGVLSISAISNSVTVGEAENRVLYTTLRMFPGRAYRIRAQIFARSESRWNLRIRQSASGVPTTANSVQNETVISPGGQGGFGTYQFEHIISPQWVTEEITEDGVEVGVGVFLSANSSTNNLYVYGSHLEGRPRTFLTVEDMGLDVPVMWQAPSSNPNDSVPAAPPPPPAKKTYSKRFGYRGWWQGWTANGRTGTESRATVGGSIYGSDMYTTIMVGIHNMTSALSGSRVKSAKVTIRRASSGGYGNATWNIGFVNAQGKPGRQPVLTNFVTGQSFGFGQARSFSVPAAHLDKLRTGAFSAIAVTPASPGSSSSYGYLDPGASSVTVTFEK